MANTTFFISWQLWLQLTFCLGSAIFLVFLAGLVKLFFKNRLVRKHTVLDEEKRARQSEMQSTGLPLPRKFDIPFGVRAIQSGVEVDGIWISRPNTPADSDGPSKTHSIHTEPKGKERTRTSQATRQPTKSSVDRPESVRSSPRLNSASGQVSPTEVRMPSTGAPATYKPRQSTRSGSGRVSGTEGKVEALDDLEGRRAALPKLDTYVPSTSAGRTPHISSLYSPAHDRRDSSSSDENPGKQFTRPSRIQTTDTPSRKRSPFEDPESASPTMDFLEDGGYFAPSAMAQRNPFIASTYEPSPRPDRQNPPSRQRRSNDATESARGRRPSQSGSVHANTQSRRVNAGFEVLPAGTFSRTNSDMDLEAQAPRGSTRLQRKTRD
ncbi:uncharacterized protein B0I36DRAFT_362922 [Microdochium trichocladiopsis]|uniref:Uncharacterized protein n=1 Tax=Microdochium trichocladiopsis TaxID=1682393 RepID=A0A9P8Y4T2_9PEZI|nr:uncharacterized protein B0I36DRAFT_362922 [Microdochium trichocladiopsis]KAH7031192.1 hypothetical protein B0I36DRAFT_362922 [Microdochium trichocladiopsis]